MIFDDVSLDDASGLILAHSVHTPDGIVRKGTVLGADDLAVLRKARVERVCAARLEPGDMAEDAAAEAVAKALAGQGVEVTRPHNGRCNLHARVQGVCTLERAAIDALNRSDTGVLVSTLPSDEVVGPGRAVATVKVVPYGVSGAVIRTLCSQVRPMVVHAFRPRKAGLILTDVAGGKDSLAGKALAVISSRLESYGSQVQWHVRVPHRRDDVVAAVEEMKEQSADLVLILGGASASDRRDIVPAAIEAATGSLDVFGIPLDPGNLLAAGTSGGVPVIGLPGCARSPRLNGVDLVLPRILAGLDVSAHALLGLGVGGLLSDIPDRPQARESHSLPVSGVKALPSVSAVILAAGEARPAGAGPGLLATWDDKPVVRHVAETVLAAPVPDVIVVTGYDADRIRDGVAGLAVSLVHNPRFMDGISTSVTAGIRSVRADCDGALVVFGDNARINAGVIGRLIVAFRKSGGTAICVPSYLGRRGNPVLWPREFFPDILDLTGDVGARRILERYEERVRDVPVDDDAILTQDSAPRDGGD